MRLSVEAEAEQQHFFAGSVLSCLLCLLFVWVVCFLKFVPFSTSVRLLGFFFFSLVLICTVMRQGYA